MANPRNLCVDVMGSTFTALLHLWADKETVEYTMTCTGAVQGGPVEMTIQDDPCNANKGQSWTCEVTRVRETILEYILVGGHSGDELTGEVHDHGPIVGYIREGACEIPMPLECPAE